MKKVYKNRLLKLAGFLERLPKDKFNFGLVRTENCKTVACAVGWCPTVFNKPVSMFMYVDKRMTKDKADGKTWYQAYWGKINEWFGMDMEETNTLFVPDSQESHNMVLDVKLENCGLRAGPTKVARNIRRFVKAVEKQEAE